MDESFSGYNQLNGNKDHSAVSAAVTLRSISLKGKVCMRLEESLLFPAFFPLSLCAVNIPISSISMKELRREMGRVEQFTSVGQHTYTASYNSIKWTNKVVLVVFQTQVNFNLIPTLLWAKGLPAV